MKKLFISFISFWLFPGLVDAAPLWYVNTSTFSDAQSALDYRCTITNTGANGLGLFATSVVVTRASVPADGTVTFGGTATGKCRMTDGKDFNSVTAVSKWVAETPPVCLSGSSYSSKITMGYYAGYTSGSAVVKTIATPAQALGANYCQSGCTVAPDIPAISALGPNGPNCSISTTAVGGYYRGSCTIPTKSVGGPCTNAPPGSSPSSNLTPAVDDPGGVPSVGPSSPSPGSCPAGSMPGGQDQSGMTICVGKTTSASAPPSSTSTTSPTINTTDGGGNSIATTTITAKNGDGSTTTTVTTVTTSPSGLKTVGTTSSTSPKSDGSSGSADSEKPKDMCALHPELNVCQNSQVMGACAQVTCTGDAIQCSTLRQASDMNCVAKQAQADMLLDASYVLGKNIASGGVDSAVGVPTKANATLVAIPGLDSSGWLGGGACFSDKTFTLQGRTFSIPFSRACDSLIMFRYAIMIVSMLVSFRMLSGVIIRE